MFNIDINIVINISIFIIFICFTFAFFKDSIKEKYENITNEEPYTFRDFNNYKGVIEIDTISSGDGIDASLLYAPCKASCCDAIYPTKSSNDYVANQYSCSTAWTNSGDSGAGCMCMTNKQREYLGSRGKNA